VTLTELFLFYGETREDLCRSLSKNLSSIQGQAAHVVTIVASTESDLQAKRTKALTKLQNPVCQEIQDVSGIYYFANKLQGKLAYLFPGEGAYYDNMLEDVRRHFPIVSDFFSFCETLKSGQKKESGSLGFAISSITTANWALFHLLSKFGLKADVAAGHSMGELAALGTSGYLETDPNFFERTNHIIDSLGCQKTEEATLFAVGAGKETVSSFQASGIYVAMDNCPHQCVAVGNKEAMARFEGELQRQNIFYELLPFHRPYHTELFLPHLEQLNTMFDNATFRKGAIPVYSCTTARPFPSDPAEIRQLAVSHWASPVRFCEMIEQMYQDGVRLFVEVGPRGNLSAFVRDILRGRPFASIASNVKHRSGVTEINHLVGQLIAHGVPLNIEERVTRTEVMKRYCQVMEQFLDLQEAYMLGRLQKKQAPRSLPLLGDIIHLESGKRVTMRRKMDLKVDLFAMHHTVGGRTLSKVDPEQSGLPLVPGTFILEMMAEAATLLVPHTKVVSLKDIRMMRWIAYEEDNPTTVEITATRLDDRVHIEIHDLEAIIFSGTVVCADLYPTPPQVQEFVLTNERKCSISLEVMGQNLFHGPLFQGVCSTDRIGDEGIESTVRVLPRESLFRSHSAPEFLLDPVLADVSMHPFVSWHLEQPDQSGRILLPAAIESFDIYGPPPPVGSRITSRGRITGTSTRHFTHEVDALLPDGTLLFQIRNAKFWRFYVPFGKVNFHGPKDEYFLSTEYPLITEHVPQTAAVRLDIPVDLKAAGMRHVTAKVTLSPQEQELYKNMQGSDTRLEEWLFGRIAAKDAIRLSWKKEHGEKLFLADIEIEADPYGRPVGRLRERSESLPAVSITHTNGIVFALASFSPHVGIDIELITPRTESFEEMAFDADERLLLNHCGANRAEWIARFWCAKEAVAKALGVGLFEGPRTLAVREKEHKTLLLEFRDQLFSAHTYRDGDLIIATSFCTKAISCKN
jgi:malonyl CoA-acyl carrier protein transacylase/phosphopantetheinyl transferase